MYWLTQTQETMIGFTACTATKGVIKTIPNIKITATYEKKFMQKRKINNLSWLLSFFRSL